jgi:hypothetical protein
MPSVTYYINGKPVEYGTPEYYEEKAIQQANREERKATAWAEAEAQGWTDVSGGAGLFQDPYGWDYSNPLPQWAYHSALRDKGLDYDIGVTGTGDLSPGVGGMPSSYTPPTQEEYDDWAETNQGGSVGGVPRPGGGFSTPSGGTADWTGGGAIDYTRGGGLQQRATQPWEQPWEGRTQGLETAQQAGGNMEALAQALAKNNWRR